MYKTAVIIYGPPGSGKGTQAKLLSEKLNFFHFDTGDFLRRIFYQSTGGFKNYLISKKEIERERKINESGGLNTTSWVLKIVSKRVEELAKLNQSIIFSGSPRTLLEAFGDRKTTGLIHLLDKIYGKKNIFVFVLDIPEAESIKRNSNRSICSVCGSPLLSQKSKVKSPAKGEARQGRQKSTCPFCGGKIEHRKDDKKEIIIGRLKEYHLKTQPIFSELKKCKYKLVKINGKPAPYQVHQQIIKYF